MSEFVQRIPNMIRVEGSRALNWYLRDQIEWSRATFGTDQRTVGICNHIRSELHEIEADPADVKEWIDVLILAMDGYWRAGGNPHDLFSLLLEKQRVNFARQWAATPPPPDAPSYHLKEEPTLDSLLCMTCLPNETGTPSPDCPDCLGTGFLTPKDGQA